MVADAEVPVSDVSADVEPDAEQVAADERLYRRKLNIVHALERIDLQVLGLQRQDIEALVDKGFQLGLAERVRQSLRVPLALRLNRASATLPPESSEAVILAEAPPVQTQISTPPMMEPQADAPVDSDPKAAPRCELTPDAEGTADLASPTSNRTHADFFGFAAAMHQLA